VPRPRTPIGTFGQIEFTTTPSGSVRARTRFRDVDGHLRRVEATAPTRKAAEHALKARLTQRADLSAGSRELAADSSFEHLVDAWLRDLDLEGRLAPSTRALYERNMRTLVQPAFEHLALREISVRRVDQFLKQLASTKSHSKARQARTVLSLAFGLAVRYGALRQNPIRDTARLRKPRNRATSLTVEQVTVIRRAVRTWRRGDGLCGPRPDGQLEQIIEVMLGTSARIGEVLALRKCDVNVTMTPAAVRICGTIVSPPHQATRRQDHPKTSKSTRTVAVPGFTAEVLRDRLVHVADQDAEHLLFFSRNRTPLTTNNVRRQLRAVLDEAGIVGVTPHSFRRTVATLVDRSGGAELAAELLGHTSSDITKQHYIEPDDQVDPLTAEILESLAPERRWDDDE
jgi:integrase